MPAKPENLFDYKQRTRTKEFGEGYDAIIWDKDKKEMPKKPGVSTSAIKKTAKRERKR